MPFLKKIGIVGSKIYYYGDRKKINFAGSSCDKYGNTSQIHANKFDNELLIKQNQTKTFFICGASMMFKRELYNKIKLFELRYFGFDAKAITLPKFIKVTRAIIRHELKAKLDELGKDK